MSDTDKGGVAAVAGENEVRDGACGLASPDEKAAEKADEKKIDADLYYIKIVRNPLPVGFGLKLLVFCISAVTFALCCTAAFVLLSDSAALEAYAARDNVFPTVTFQIGTVLAVAFIIVILLYVFFTVFTDKGSASRYCIIVGKLGDSVCLVIFLVFGICIAATLANCSAHPVLSAAVVMFGASVSYIPIAISWRIYEEDRLKNFIDGFSKACSCMAFMGGIIAFLLNAFIGK